ncbi:cytochrome P450 [Streptomyces sp. NBC_01221]|uniref:cytochrome P450 n=1 Tax=unclassified Streptomyces TaxID=2593676 RepID=UPI002253F344|nr:MULTISPECIES: cytochrome P450 [unclassified Streptomyces]MCX4785251.1 cytochrome P450 [Streptomyces sp. NBC_01221]WSJ40012.1 cytochrome P450 [Streptomyces sp. NBC_01321]
MSTLPPPGCPSHAGHGTGLLPLSAVVGSSDPHAVYRRLRKEWGSVAKVELEPGVPAWLVMGYQELLVITRQEQLYSRDARNWRDLNEGVVSPHSGLLPMMGWRANVIGADGPEHRRLRKPLDDGIARIDQRRVRREVEALCTDLIASFSERGSADLVNEYATIVPMLSLASLFGLDSEEGRELLDALIALFGSAGDSQAGNRNFEQILLDTVRERRSNPTDDMTTVFINHPNLRNEAERLQSIVVMISAGNETVTAWISHTLRLMLTDPRFAARLHGGRLGVDDALDEALWRDPPMNNMPARYALHDTELGGRHIRRGDCLILGHAAANDDPEVRPDGADERWGNRSHLAFSAGPHVCPAQVPARLITRTAVQTALHLLPDMRLGIPADEVAWRPSPWTRVPVALPAEFSAARIPARIPTTTGR